MYYIVAGTERLMQIMRKQHEINPDIFIALTNGAYLSPWWLQYADVIWLINCGDAPRDCKDRSEELVFRGYLFERLYAESSFCMAVLVSGLLYGLAHGIFSFAVLRASWWEIFSNIGGGIVGTAFYAFLFKQTGTIAVPVLVHWALDFCGYIF